jgi:hypothetical protein
VIHFWGKYIRVHVLRLPETRQLARRGRQLCRKRWPNVADTLDRGILEMKVFDQSYVE